MVAGSPTSLGQALSRFLARLLPTDLRKVAEEGRVVVGISMVRDEIDIIEATIQHMAHQCDRLLVADNASIDGTREVLDRLVCDVVDDEERGYYQAQKMTKLALTAYDEGAEWIVPFDADERWLADGVRVSELLSSLPDEAMVCEAKVLDHVASPIEGMPYRRKAMLPLRKVACRANANLSIGQGNHSAAYPDTPFPYTVTDRLQIRHFPYRTPEQFIKKARNGAEAYAATDLPEDVGKHWRDYGRLDNQQLREVFFEWFYSEDPENDPELLYDPCPVLSRS